MTPVALITGAAKRIGRQLALRLAAEGWDIVVHYNKSEEAAKGLVAAIYEHSQRQSHLLQADLADMAQVNQLVERSINLTGEGRLRLLVNNASIFPHGSFLESPADDLMHIMQINLAAPYELMRSFAARVDQGVIINIVDAMIRCHQTSSFPYLLTKKALWELTKMAALELAPKVRVNAVSPGLILPPSGEGNPYLEKIAPLVPINRSGSPGDIGKAVLFLLEHSYITGQNIYVDGGSNLLGHEL